MFSIINNSTLDGDKLEDIIRHFQQYVSDKTYVRGIGFSNCYVKIVRGRTSTTFIIRDK